ncbi:MAG: hypothetical protein FD123_1219 [Bacteroidetes bacterium]|nr:MAG: hypothetical protein FD123_1219 [Bacteroidota bacterium]
MKLTREVKTGIVVVVAIALFIYGYNFLKGRDLFSTSTDLFARYERVEGMTANSAVWLNGFKVGQVRDIRLDPKTNDLIVHFTISNSDARIPLNAIARIASDGLLGTKVVQLVIPEGTNTALLDDKSFAADGDTLVGDVAKGLQDAVTAEVKPLKDKVQGLVASIDSVVTIIQVILNKDARENLVKSFESIKNALATFEHTAQQLDTLVASERTRLSDIFVKIQSIATNLANNNEKLSKIMSNTEAITDSLAKSNLTQTIDRVNKTMGEVAVIMEKINKGEGSMGLLVNDKKLYNNLDSASAALSRLITDLNEHPKRYVHFSVFGKSDKKKTATPPKKTPN